MAAILKLRRASTTPNLVKSELFYNEQKETLQIGTSDIANTDVITLVKLTDINTGNLQIVGTISGSALNLSGDITASSAYFKGDVRLDGQIVLGDVPQDNISVNAQFSGSLIPSGSSSTFDLGSQTQYWRNVYATNLNGTITDTKILQFTASQEAKDSTLATYTGSVDTTLSNLATKNNTLGTYTGSIDNKFITLGNYTGSNNTKWNTLENVTSSILQHTESINNKFTTLSTYTQSVDNSISLLNTFSSSEETKNSTLASYTGSVDLDITELYATASDHENRIIYLSGSFSQSVDDRLDQLEVNSGSVNNAVSLLGIFSASEETKNSTLASYTGSVNNQLTELYTTASNHEVRIDGIQDYTASVKTALELTGSNVTILGNLNVRGTQTVINSTVVQLDDSVIRLNGTGASNGGLLIKDPTSPNTLSGSLLWDTTNDYWKGGPLNQESKLLLAGGDDVVSGSEQVVDSLKLTFLEIEGDNVVSGSSQIDLTQTTNYNSGIKARLNAETVISGSSQVIISESVDYVSSIKHRLNIEGVISSSIQVDVLNTTNFTTYSSSVDDKLIQLANDSASQDGRLDNLELFSSSQETKDSTLATYTGSIDTKWSTLENVTSSLINATASYETRGNNIVSGSSQLTESYDLRYANSASFHNLVGAWDFGTQGSIRDAAFYNVTSSAQLDTGSANFTSSLNDSIIFTAGAVKEYVNFRTEAILTAIGAADITAVNAGNGLSGGGLTGDVTLDLNTGSVHFTNGVKTKLNTDGVISGSSQIVSILEPLNTFSSSQESKDSTLATYTGSVNNQLTELYSTASNHEVRIDNLEIFSSSINTSYEQIASGTHTLISGSSQLSGKVIPNLSGSFTGSYTGSFTGSFKGTLSGLADYALYPLVTNSGPTTDTSLFPIFTSNANVNQYATLLSHPSSSFFFNGVTRQLNAEGFVGAIYATNGVLSGSAQIIDILGPLNTFSASQEAKDSTLASYTASVDNSLNGLNAVSHSHSNKANLDTINQNLSTTSDVTFGSLHTSGTGSIGTNLTIYGNLTVFGTQSVINSENLSVNDNLIYLAPTASGDYDLGIVGHYNDGTYSHAGIFTDASDGHAWKVFKGLTAEVSGSVDTSHPSFTLADFKAANITATSFNGVINATNGVLSGSLQAQLPAGVVSGSSQVILSSTTGGGTSANVQFGSLGIGMAASGTSGRIDATNDIVAYSSSDRRFKENIIPIENALDKINQIGGYEFDWKEENKIEHGYEGHDLGVIAQEIEAIAPELVQTRENGYKAVKYDKLVSVLIQAVKELSAKVTELENK